MMTNNMKKLSQILFYCILIMACLTLAQTDPAETESVGEAQPREEESQDNQGQYLVVNELGFGVGYPSYQLYHVYYSLQRDVFGVAFRGSYTVSNGLYAGLSGRYYTPIPVPVPTFISLGAGLSGTGLNISATLGTHVPLGLNSPLRATLEAGLGYEAGDNAGLRFVASLGVGYVFYVDTAPISDQERRRRELARLEYCAEDKITDPNPDTLEEAFDIALDDFLDKAKAQYAGTFQGLSYDLDFVSQEINGAEATMVFDFSGSVTVKATGNKERASGTITALFGWTGCSWKLLEYNVD
jgi:hypothetical protein